VRMLGEYEEIWVYVWMFGEYEDDGCVMCILGEFCGLLGCYEDDG
jgi:hypothetical protein